MTDLDKLEVSLIFQDALKSRRCLVSRVGQIEPGKKNGGPFLSKQDENQVYGLEQVSDAMTTLGTCPWGTPLLIH